MFTLRFNLASRSSCAVTHYYIVPIPRDSNILVNIFISSVQDFGFFFRISS